MQLYRYERLEYFITMLQTGNVSFGHPSQWPDPYESKFLTAGHTIEHALTLGSDGMYRGSLPRGPHSTTAHLSFANPFGTFVFAQCFTGELHESEWGWAAGGRDRVRWSVDSDGYVAALRGAEEKLEVTLAEVRYHSAAKVKEIQDSFVTKYGGGVRGTKFEQWCLDVIAPLSTKRIDFQDQQEHRVIVIETDYFRKLAATRAPPPPPMPVARPRMVVNVKFAELVTDVVLHPSTTVAEAASDELRIRRAGFSGRVSRSQLYSNPELGTRTVKPLTNA